jgi:hypothetical protein
LPNSASGESMIGDDGGTFRTHQHKLGVEDRAAIEGAELSVGVAPDAEGILAADKPQQTAWVILCG